jgi:hypothetical protein
VEAKVEELALNAAVPSTGPATDAAATILKAAPNAGRKVKKTKWQVKAKSRAAAAVVAAATAIAASAKAWKARSRRSERRTG